jgi:hypothetical protein
VTIGIFELEAAQTVVGIGERLRKGDIAGRELRRQRIRIRHIEVGIPSRSRVALAVGKRFDPDILDHDHRAGPAHDHMSPKK